MNTMNTQNSSRKKTWPKRILPGVCLGLLSLVSLCASATTYYVDFAGGNDLNNGTALSSPWQHCPGDTNATGVPLTTTFAAGDTVIFKGGVQYLGQIALNWSGSSTSPITYDGNSAGTFGTGQAFLNGQYASNQLYGLYTRNGRSNLILNSFEIGCIGGHSNITWTCTNLPPYVIDYGIYLSMCSGVTISNCYIHDIGDWTNAPNMSLDCMSGYGLCIMSSSTVTITNCCFQHIGQAAIQVCPQTGNYVATNINICGCVISNYVTWGVNIACVKNNSVLQGVTIDGLVIHDYPYEASSWLGCAGKFPHSDGIFCFLGGHPAASNCILGTLAAPIVIRNSYFYNYADPSTNSAGTACVTLSEWGGVVEIYNNVFINVLNSGEGAIFMDEGTYGYSPGTSQPNYFIFNNTFYDTNRLAVDIRWMTNSIITVENNIFFNGASAGGGVPLILDALPNTQTNILSIDYNLYYTTSSTGGGAIGRIGTTYLTFPQLQAAGFEAHGVYGNPKLVNTSFGFGANCSFNNLHLTPSNPAIGAGTNMSWMFATDKEGLPRPSTGNWDLGAYQQSVVLSPPTNLRVVGP